MRGLRPANIRSRWPCSACARSSWAPTRVLTNRRQVTLMFNAAGRLEGEFPHLEGNTVKYMRFTDLAAVEARADELQAIAKAWCAHTQAARNSRA